MICSKAAVTAFSHRFASCVPDCCWYQSACSTMSAAAASLSVSLAVLTSAASAGVRLASNPFCGFRKPQAQFWLPWPPPADPLAGYRACVPCLGVSVHEHIHWECPNPQTQPDLRYIPSTPREEKYLKKSWAYLHIMTVYEVMYNLEPGQRCES